MRLKTSLVVVASAAAVAASAMFLPGRSGPIAVASAKRPSAASVHAAGFVQHITNPYYPLRPGTLLVYKGIKDGQTQVDRVFVTHKTKMIQGIRATVVRDVARHSGRLLEKTIDWFAQDTAGNVWYMGENTKAFDRNGHVDTEGSWQSGVNGARRGIIMKADPRAPSAYRQEYYKGHAEDQAWVVGHKRHMTEPYGRLDHILLSLEWSRLEPQVIDRKVYARGIGIVREIAMSGPHETAHLVRVKRT